MPAPHPHHHTVTSLPVAEPQRHLLDRVARALSVAAKIFLALLSVYALFSRMSTH